MNNMPCLKGSRSPAELIGPIGTGIREQPIFSEGQVFFWVKDTVIP